MAHLMQENARCLAVRMPKRKLLQQRSFSDPALFSTPRRARRNNLHPMGMPELPQYSRWVIMPRATWKVRWDLWIGLIIAYSVILIPYRIGFAIDIDPWEQLLNYAFDGSFAIDMLFNCFTGYYDEDVFVHELPRIRARYLRGWFLFDLVSTIPLDQLLQQVVATTASSLETLKLVRVFRLFRLLKLMRLLRLKRAVQSMQMDALNAHVLQTVKTLLIIVFIIHLVACGWYMFYTWDPEGVNWVTRLSSNGLESPYLVSFYWVSNTMMSVGYGDIYGITDGERLYAIGVACLGSMCVGMIIANIQMLTENYNPRGIKLRQKMQDTKEFLLKRGIPRRLRQRILSQFEFHWSHRTVFEEDRLLEKFPRSLQYEILAASMEAFVKQFPFFGVTSVEFFVFAIPRLRPIVLSPAQVLVDAESVWEELYFITVGTVETIRSNIVVGSLSPGDICGIEYLVNERRRYTHTYRSVSKTELYAMHSEDLMRAIDKCPVAHKYLHDLASIISERYEESARRGKRALQRQKSMRSIRRASYSKTQPFLHNRHRKSASAFNVHTSAANFMGRTATDVGISPDELRLHWSVIRHYSRPRILWDIVISIMVSITAIAVPFRIAFDVQDTLLLFATDRLSDVIFFFDVILNFCTTYVDETGVEIVDRYEIRRHYLKTSFFVDVLSTIPFDFLVDLMTSGTNFVSLRLIRTVKLVKLLRLMRLSKLLKMNAQWTSEFDISIDTVRLLKLLAPVMISAHYVGCFWYYMSAEHNPQSAWWGRVHFEHPESTFSRYVASVYWAITTMTTVGFGDVFAVNDYEKYYSIVVLIGGTTLFAYVVGTVIEVASNSKSLMNRAHEMGQNVNAYIKERGVSPEFATACQEHLRFLDNEKTLFNENSLFDALSYSLRSELILYLNGGVISKIRFFDKKPKWFLTLMLPRLVPQFFLKGDLLIYQDNPVTGIFFIMSGAVVARMRSCSTGQSSVAGTTYGRSDSSADHIIADHNGVIAKICESEFFGYKEMLTESNAQYNVFALQPTGTYMLPREFLDDFEVLYPLVVDEIRSFIMQSIIKQQTVVSSWQNNEAIGLSGNDRERITELGVERRARRATASIPEVAAAVEAGVGSSSRGRRHSSFNETRVRNSPRHSDPPMYDILKEAGPRASFFNNMNNLTHSAQMEESSTRFDSTELVRSMSRISSSSTPRDVSANRVPALPTKPVLTPRVSLSDGLALSSVSSPIPTPREAAPEENAVPVSHLNEQTTGRLNTATTGSTVHPTLDDMASREALYMRPRTASSASFRNTRRASHGNIALPSSARNSSADSTVNVLVDRLLRRDGYHIQRMPSGQKLTPTVTR